MTLAPSIRRLRSVLAGGTAALALCALVSPAQALAQAGTVPAAAAQAVASPASQGAALWVVRDEDSTLYLFGTFHALRPETPWRSEQVSKAFASADEYWFEVANIKDMSEALPIIQAKGMSPDRPLSSLLSPEDMTSLEKAAQTLGMPVASLDPMRPWLANLTLAVATIISAGYVAEQGVDHVLHAEAEATGKPIKGFETMGQQVGFLANMDEATQLQALREGLREFDMSARLVDQMVEAWATSDLEQLDQLAGASLRQSSPEVYEVIFARRNQNWAEQVERLLAGSGTQFIAVGAGHLVGPDSLQVQLERRGIRSEQLGPD